LNVDRVLVVGRVLVLNTPPYLAELGHGHPVAHRLALHVHGHDAVTAATVLIKLVRPHAPVPRPLNVAPQVGIESKP